MSVYCTTTQVERHLEASHGLTIATYITEASGIVNDDLENRYCIFPDVTDTPATPAKIQRAAHLMAGLLCREALGTTNRLNEDGTTVDLEERYQKVIDDLLDDQRPGRALARVTIVDEVMTFGTDPVGDNEYKLDPGGLIADGTIGSGDFEVIAEDATVTCAAEAVQYGVDFKVFYSVKDNGWLLERLNSAIVDTDTVTYKVSWYRHREAMGPTTRRGGTLVLT